MSFLAQLTWIHHFYPCSPYLQEKCDSPVSAQLSIRWIGFFHLQPVNSKLLVDEQIYEKDIQIMISVYLNVSDRQMQSVGEYCICE